MGTGESGPPPQAQATNVLAVWAFACAFVFSPAATILGHVARREIRRTGEPGHGLATAALILGYAGPIALLLAIVVWFVLPAAHPAPQTTLSYTQFVSDVSAGKVKSVGIATSAGGMSTGTLKDGTSYAVIIPPQVGQSLLAELADHNVQVTASS